MSADRERLNRAVSEGVQAITARLAKALVQGYYGTVHVSFHVQDGVLQHIKSSDEQISKPEM